jgi:hypothetical protein
MLDFVRFSFLLLLLLLSIIRLVAILQPVFNNQSPPFLFCLVLIEGPGDDVDDDAVDLI